MPIRTILIDDHRLFNDGLSLVLRDSPDFIVAGQIYDSRLALEACMHLSPDLVLVDINMPHVDGLTIIRQLRELAATCKIVIISMYAEQQEIARFHSLRIDGYIAKTVAAERLLELLRRVMAGEPVTETDAVTSENPAVLNPAQQTYGLTKREIEILRRIKLGLTTEQIARELILSYYTVQTHRKNISQKLPFSTKKQFYDFLETLD